MKKKVNLFPILGVLCLMLNACSGSSLLYNQLRFQKSYQKNSPIAEPTATEKNSEGSSIPKTTPESYPEITQNERVRNFSLPKGYAEKISVASLDNPRKVLEKLENTAFEKIKTATVPCSTIVLKNGKTIEARDIKVTSRNVSFKTCGNEKEYLFVPRKSVSRIIASKDLERINSGVSEGRMKDRYNNYFSLFYFIISMGILVLCLYMLAFYGLTAISFLVSGIGLILGALLLFFALTDLSTIRGVMFTIAGLVLSACAFIIAGLVEIDKSN